MSREIATGLQNDDIAAVWVQDRWEAHTFCGMKIDGTGYRAAHLAELESVPWKGGLTLRPLAGELGIAAFGCAAFSAVHAGQPVVEPHRESPDGRGHQELYFVARGHALFILDGRELDAPAGTLVFVDDPRVHREATAVADDTTVLAFGGEPTFAVGADELIARVRARVGAGDRDGAVDLARLELEQRPHSAGRQYALALALVAVGDLDLARPLLASAIALEPGLRDEACRDPKLAALV